MIGYLKGIIIEKRSPDIWIDVRDIGYRVKVGQSLISTHSIGDQIELFIHTYVRQDTLELYGFQTKQQLQMFELILSVSGIGPKIGLSILGTKSVDQIEKAVSHADVSFFSSVPGIGKKGAQRIIVDLKKKLPSLKDLDLAADFQNRPVIDALKQFGFSQAEINAVLNSLDSNLPEAELIKQSLKLLGK